MTEIQTETREFPSLPASKSRKENSIKKKCVIINRENTNGSIIINKYIKMITIIIMMIIKNSVHMYLCSVPRPHSPYCIAE